MANDNPSRDNPSRQQSAERSQTGTAQQGTGASYGQGTQGGHQGSQGPSTYGQGGQGRHGQGGQGGYGSGQDQGRYGQGREGRGVGTSTWQGGRQSGGALATRGGSSPSPYYGSGYGSGPFSVMRRISDEMDRLFENFGMGRSLFGGDQDIGRGMDVGGYGQAPTMWSPHIEVFERGGKLVIQADLPGMKRDDINVRIEDDEVVIQGERRQEQTNNQGGYYRSERSYGSFYRTIPLPEGTNADSANATFRDGVLEIELEAPRQQQRGRTLEIRDATTASGGSSSGTGSGTTYGSGTTGSMQGTSGSTSSQHLQSGTGTSQHASGSGTMYSGSGNPSVGGAGMGGSQAGSSDKSRSNT